MLRHLRRGDHVGLAIVAARTLAFIEPASSPGHAVKLVNALAYTTGCLEPERSGLDEVDVAARVLEHLRPLDARAAQNLRPNELDRIARRAERVMQQRALFRGAAVPAATRRERQLRNYLGAFGLGSPARLEPDRLRTDVELARLLVRLAREKASTEPDLPVVADAGSRNAPRAGACAREPAAPARFELNWMGVPLDAGMSADEPGVPQVVTATVSLRAQAAVRRGERALRRLGVRLDAGRRATERA